MASAPTTTGNAPAYRPLFKRVAQNDTKDGIHSADFLGDLACIATIVGASLDEVRACAIKNGLPKHGPFWVTADLIAKVFASFGYQSSPDWLQVFTPLDALPSIAILLTEYNEATEIGRAVVMQKVASKNDPKGYETWIIDPAYWQSAEKQVTDNWKSTMSSWYLGVYPMPYPTSGLPKTPPTAAKK